MVSPAILAKEHQDIPDSFIMKIHYVTGKMEEFEVSERGGVELGAITFVTKDDIWHTVVIQNVLRIEYDKSYSKLVAIRQEEMRNAAQKG